MNFNIVSAPGMAAKGSEGTAGVAAPSSPSLPAAQEGRYASLRMMGVEAEEKNDEAIMARVATVRDREERLAAIVADLRKMEEQRRAAGVHPTDAELAAYVILHESADAALEGLPTLFGPME